MKVETATTAIIIASQLLPTAAGSQARKRVSLRKVYEVEDTVEQERSGETEGAFAEDMDLWRYLLQETRMLGHHDMSMSMSMDMSMSMMTMAPVMTMAPTMAPSMAATPVPTFEPSMGGSEMPSMSVSEAPSEIQLRIGGDDPESAPKEEDITPKVNEPIVVDPNIQIASDSENETPQTENEPESSSNPGKIAGIVIGSLAAVALLMVAVIGTVVYKKKQQRQELENATIIHAGPQLDEASMGNMIEA